MPKSPEKKTAAKTEASKTSRSEGSALKDDSFFQAFQSNLLSLISHELRTPLTGVLNALSLLDESGSDTGFSSGELISMAKRNADRLHHTLATLLDLTAIESGTLSMRFREADLQRFVSRKQKSIEETLRASGFAPRFQFVKNSPAVPILLEPQKFSRVMGLLTQILLNRAEPKSDIEFFVDPTKVGLRFKLSSEAKLNWQKEWEDSTKALTDRTQMMSFFQGALLTEDQFLTRTQEGLGSELWLCQELIKRHMGKFSSQFLEGSKVELIVELPVLSSMQHLRAILLARVFDSSTDLGSVALGLMEIPKGLSGEDFRKKVRACLFRASDTVYFLESENRVAIFLNDCKPEDAPRLMGRIEGKLGQKIFYGTAICPEEGSDPDHLVDLAEKRLKSNRK